jgi:anti-sigma regulatory factor (Ser/Thr protein kinase)
MTGERVDEAQEWLSAIARGERWYDPRTSSMSAASRTLTVGLTALPESVKQARDFARTALCAWGLGDLYDDVRLVVSELVTNAMRHGSEVPDGSGDPTIQLSMLSAGGRLTCAVTDPSDLIPVHREPDFASQTGRGLQLVEAFSDSWDWVPLSGHGKIVWACFRCP